MEVGEEARPADAELLRAKGESPIIFLFTVSYNYFHGMILER